MPGAPPLNPTSFRADPEGMPQLRRLHGFRHKETLARSRTALVGMSAAIACVLAACAAIPWPQPPRTPSSSVRRSDRWLDLRGVVHVHTRGSHDSPGTVEEVVEAARSAGLEWVALTEHFEPGELPSWGRIRGVTILPGYELRAAGASLFAIGVSERPPELPDPVALVRRIHELHGVAVVGHFEQSQLADPGAFERAAPDGVEIVNLHALARERTWSLAWKGVFLPTPVALRSLLRVPEANIARWERLPGSPTLVAGVDAHAKFRVLGALGGTLDRYRDIFRSLTTHVLARDADAASILEALRAGRTYVAVESLAPVDTFVFERRGKDFLLEAPAEARLALVCDGVEVASVLARRAELSPSPGARRCRAEAWRSKRLWIMTGHLEAATAPGHS